MIAPVTLRCIKTNHDDDEWQRADPCRAAARHHHIVLYVRKEQSFKDTENYMLMLEKLVLLYRTVLTDAMEP